MDSSAKLALESDRPISCYLSGGIDSTLLLDAIKRMGGEVTTLTASFDDKSAQSHCAAETASSFGFPHELIQLGEESLDQLPRVVGQMGTPLGDGLILAFDALAKASAELGCPVALGGEGPNELFQGHLFQQNLKQAESQGPLGRRLASMALKFAPQSRIEDRYPINLSGRKTISNWLDHYPKATPWEKGIGLRTLFSPTEIRELLLDPLWIEPSLSPGVNLRDQHHRHQFVDWLPDWIILRQNRNAVAHAVEYRMPFLNSKLISFSGKLEERQKLRGKTGKWIWRELAKVRLQKSPAIRAQKPFHFPIEKFANSNQWKTLVGDLLSPNALNRDYIFRSETVEKLKKQAQIGGGLALKQLMALVIFQLWKDQLD